MHRAKLMLIALLILTTALIGASFVSADAPEITSGKPARGIRIERIGNPTWRPVDFHIVAGEIGTLDSGFDKFGATISAMLPPPNHVLGPCGICPGDPHAPPYDKEFAEGIAASGFHEGVRFSEEEMLNGMAIFVTYMVVPRANAPSGSSPDFANGPIIPHSVFPIHVEGQSTVDGRPFDPFLVITDVLTLDDFGFPGYDGHSHFPMFIATNDEFRELAGRPPMDIEGSHLYKFRMTDTTGQGWVIKARFTVED
jgi:hypothetical protein